MPFKTKWSERDPRPRAGSWPIVHIGPAVARIIQPTAFSVAAGGTFVVADAPGNADRIEAFSDTKQ